MSGLRARLRALLRREKPGRALEKELDNPYRRLYTPARSLEELARNAREAEKRPGSKK